MNYLTGEHTESHESMVSSNESAIEDMAFRLEIDLSPIDFWKKTPLDYALEYKYEECYNIIESAISRRKASRSLLPNIVE